MVQKVYDTKFVGYCFLSIWDKDHQRQAVRKHT